MSFDPKDPGSPCTRVLRSFLRTELRGKMVFGPAWALGFINRKIKGLEETAKSSLPATKYPRSPLKNTQSLKAHHYCLGFSNNHQQLASSVGKECRRSHMAEVGDQDQPVCRDENCCSPCYCPSSLAPGDIQQGAKGPEPTGQEHFTSKIGGGGGVEQ